MNMEDFRLEDIGASRLSSALLFPCSNGKGNRGRAPGHDSE